MQRLDLRTGQEARTSARARETPVADRRLPDARRSAGRGGRPGVRAGGGGGGGRRLGRWHWDSPIIISPHSARRLYFAGERVYRSDDRGDTWTAISGDLTRHLDATKIPIMGKVWPPDSVAFNQATTTLSTITALDESPLLEGLIYAGTDDGVVQVTEDGGKAWRKIDAFPGVPEHTYVSEVSRPRRATPTPESLSYEQHLRGDCKP